MQNTNSMTIPQIARKLGRKNNTIREYCRRNDIKVKRERNYISDDEITYILENKDSRSVTELAKDLNRDRETISDYCKRNNIEVFIKKIDIDFMKENTNMTKVEMALYFQTSVTTIGKLCKMQGITLKESKNYISEEEKEIIEKNTDKTAKEIAVLLRKSESSIINYCKRKGIKFKEASNKLTLGEIEYIIKASTKMTVKEIAEKTGRSKSTIKKYLTSFTANRRQYQC